MKPRILWCLGITAALAAAADLPYAGKWKANLAKSDLGQTTVTYESMSGGEMKASADGQSFTFKTDGKDYSTPWGTTAAYKSLDANSWEETDKMNGKVLGTSTIKVSADGKTLTVDSKMMQADGGSHQDTTVYQRVSGGPGLAGKWKTKNVKSTSPMTMDISASGSNGLKLTLADIGGSCDGQFDGKDYPCTGPMWASGWTWMIAKNGARGFDSTVKKDGKPMYRDTYTVSADGKTLTDNGGAVGANEKVKMVYDRQ
jgi:hypothetical protein